MKFISVFGWLTMLMCSVAATADTFTVPLALRHAQSLYDQQRFSAAAGVLRDLNDGSIDLLSARPDTRLNVIDLMARAYSAAGDAHSAAQWMALRHQLIASVYDEHGLVYAASLTRLAETRYRQGRTDEALLLVNQAIALYHDLNPTPEEAARVAERNRAQYRVTPFDPRSLPTDLSVFYAACEAAAAGSVTESGLGSFQEVGVDYQPNGSWTSYFDHLRAAAEQPSVRLFLPSLKESLRRHVCIVPEQRAGFLALDESSD